MNPNHKFLLLRIIKKLGNDETINIIRKLCEYNL
jgi:hypothetical protein